MIAVPLVVKELRAGSRRWTTYATRALYVGIAALILYFFWDGNRAEFGSPSEYAQLGRSLFTSINFLQFPAAVLGAMLGCSDAITSEVRAGTLGIVLMTPLTPLRVVLAKWCAVLLQTLALLASGAPALAVCAYLGGIGTEDLLSALGWCLASSAFGAALTLHASSKARSAMRAFFTALGRFLLLYFAFAIGFQIVLLGLGLGGNPAFVFLVLRYGALGVMLLLTVLLLGLAARNTRRRLSHPEKWNVQAHAYETRPSYYSKIQKDGKRLVIRAGVWEERPLLWKDLATRSAGRVSSVARVLLALVLGLFVLLGTSNIDARHTGWIYVWGTVLLVLAVAQGAGLFAPENAERRWDMLLTAPVSPARIVGSKLLAGLVAPEAVVACLILLFPLGAKAFLDPSGGGYFLALSGLLFLGFAYLLAAFCSLHSRTSRNAFLTAGTFVTLLLILPGLLGDADETGLLATLNPASLFEIAVHSHFDSRWIQTVQGRFVPHFFLQWTLFGGASVVLAVLLCRRFRRMAASY